MSDEIQHETSLLMPQTPQPAPQADERMDLLSQQLLEELLERMGYSLTVELTVEQERILLNISGDEAEALIGNKGQTLDALQFLLGRMLNRVLPREHTPVVVDSGGYRERRSEALCELALRLGDKAVRTGKIVAVNPMSAHDRRIIHMALREIPGVTTRSEGDGFERRLLIVPEPA